MLLLSGQRVPPASPMLLDTVYLKCRVEFVTMGMYPYQSILLPKQLLKVILQILAPTVNPKVRYPVTITMQ